MNENPSKMAAKLLCTCVRVPRIPCSMAGNFSSGLPTREEKHNTHRGKGGDRHFFSGGPTGEKTHNTHQGRGQTEFCFVMQSEVTWPKFCEKATKSIETIQQLENIIVIARLLSFPTVLPSFKHSELWKES